VLISACCAQLSATVVGAAPAIEAVADRACGPLVVAVAGRVNAGKSTLVNAVLRRSVAPTAITECTSMVARFVEAHAERVVVCRTDGSEHSVSLGDDRALPTTVGTPPDLVDHLDVELATSALRDVVLVDTPGLASVRSENSDRTEGFLGLDP